MDRIHQRVVENSHVFALHNDLDQPVNDRLAGAVAVVDDPVAAVAGFKGFAKRSVGIYVKVNAKLLDFHNVKGTLSDKLFNRRKLVFVFARNQRVVDMELVAVVDSVEHAGNAALGKRAV